MGESGCAEGGCSSGCAEIGGCSSDYVALSIPIISLILLLARAASPFLIHKVQRPRGSCFWLPAIQLLANFDLLLSLVMSLRFSNIHLAIGGGHAIFGQFSYIYVISVWFEGPLGFGLLLSSRITQAFQLYHMFLKNFTIEFFTWWSPLEIFFSSRDDYHLLVKEQETGVRRSIILFILKDQLLDRATPQTIVQKINSSVSPQGSLNNKRPKSSLRHSRFAGESRTNNSSVSPQRSLDNKNQKASLRHLRSVGDFTGQNLSIDVGAIQIQISDSEGEGGLSDGSVERKIRQAPDHAMRSDKISKW